MNKNLYDTNVVIDFLNGATYAKKLIESCKDRALSIISVIEILSAVPELQEHTVYHWLYNDFKVFGVDDVISKEAIKLRRHTKKLKLPDTLVLASAIAYGYTLYTRDAKYFASYKNVEIVQA